MAPHKIHTSIKLLNYRHSTTAKDNERRSDSFSKSVTRRLRLDILIKRRLTRWQPRHESLARVSVALFGLAGATSPSTFWRYLPCYIDDANYFSYIFCWSFSFAKTTSTTTKKNPSNELKKSPRPTKCFKLNSPPVFLNLTIRKKSQQSAERT